MAGPLRWIALAACAAAIVAAAAAAIRFEQAAASNGRSGAQLAPTRAPAGTVSPPAVNRIPVTIAEARLVRLPATRTGVGWVESIAAVKVRPRVEGTVTERLVEDGATVAKGAVLFRLDDREIRAQLAREQAALAREKATLTRHEEELRRARDLFGRNIGSQMRLDQIESDVRIAAANVALAEAAIRSAAIRLDHTIVRAPLSGRVGVVKAWEGSLVGPTDGELLTVSTTRPLQVAFAFHDRDLALLHDAMSTQAPRVRIFAAEGGAPLAQGRIGFIDSAVDTASGTILVKATIVDGAEALWPGQHVRVETDLGEGPELVAVPVGAVELPRAGERRGTVFVVNPSDEASRREVEIERIESDWAALRAGLRAGERVALEGRFRLRDGARIVVVEPVAARLRTGGSPP